MMARRAPTGAPLGLACLLGGIACGTRAPEKTAEPPDLTSIVALYDAPTAAFDEADVDAIAPVLLATATQIAALAIETELESLLDAIAQAEIDAEVATTLEAGGFVRVTRICPGWQRTPVADRDANGAQIATARFSESGIEPLVWGTVDRCRYRLGETRVEIDAADDAEFALAIVRKEPAPGENADATGDEPTAVPTLFVLRLAVTIDAEASQLSTDFCVVPQGVEYRVPRDDGSLVARLAPDGALHVRAANGAFVCDESSGCQPAGAAP